MRPIFALIDCNNFFVSCERLFRPDLEGKPVVVLSSNDGCIVARSNEAKQLGIPMGAPVFKLRQLFRQHNITTFSANFELYGDISKRITALLTTVTPRIEVYSVDESFLDLSLLQINDYRSWGRAVRASVLKNIGVPVSIGIAPSKTLAKLASELAKRDSYHDVLHPSEQTNTRNGLTPDGVVSFVGMQQPAVDGLLRSMSIKEIWGIGWRLAPKMQAAGISTAFHMAHMRPQHAQQLMGIHGRQMVAELNGISCYPLEREHKIAKSIMRGRTFGEDTNQAHVLEAAIATMATRAAFALRRDHLLARRIGFFTETNRHKPGYRRWSPTITLDQPTNDTGLIISLLIEKLAEIFNNAQQYHRLSIFLDDFVPEGALQTDLLGHVNPVQHDKSAARMQAIDHINTRHGKGKIYYAAENLASSWQPKQQIRSPRYVSKWSELPEARIIQSTRRNNV